MSRQSTRQVKADTRYSAKAGRKYIHIKTPRRQQCIFIDALTPVGDAYLCTGVDQHIVQFAIRDGLLPVVVVDERQFIPAEAWPDFLAWLDAEVARQLKQRTKSNIVSFTPTGGPK